MKSQTSHMFGHQKRYPRKRMTVVIFRVSRVSKTQTFPLRTNHDGGANLSEVLTWKKKDCRSNLWILLWLGTEIFQVSHKSYVSCLFSFCWFVRWFFFFFFSIFERIFILISPYFISRQYFLVLFKNHTVELWDALHLRQLREFPSNFPKITAFVSKVPSF